MKKKNIIITDRNEKTKTFVVNDSENIEIVENIKRIVCMIWKVYTI